MAVIAVFKYKVKPGRMPEFMSKLQRAAGHEFQSDVMPKSVRLMQSTVPGPEFGGVTVMVEYEDMAAYGARAVYENQNSKWRKLFAPIPDSPEQLESVELLTELET